MSTTTYLRDDSSGIIRLTIIQARLAESAQESYLVQPYVQYKYRDIEMRTTKKLFKGKKLIVDKNKKQDTFDETFKINMFDKSDEIVIQLRDDYFTSKLSKKDSNNDTCVGELRIKCEELIKGSGNKLWYDLDFDHKNDKKRDV